MADLWENEPDLEQLRRAHSLLRSNPAQALLALKALAERGSTMSMLYIGEAYDEKGAATTDLTRAAEWYSRAADRGSTLGRYKLGRVYLDLERYGEARQMFEMGVSENYAPSMNMLGMMYMKGIGINRDVSRARPLFERSASLGHVFAKKKSRSHIPQRHFWDTPILERYLFISVFKDILTIVRTDPRSERLS